MGYSVKEIYYTIQGEGANTGRPAVFCRFSGCNLWTGRETDRETAICQFCDTDFLGTDGRGGGKFASAIALADAILKMWPASFAKNCSPFVVCTGGEPLLQLDSLLVDALHDKGFEIAIETNGTQMRPEEIDWVCVSPKAGSELIMKEGNELKLVYPQEGAPPEKFEKLNFEHFMLQPMDGPCRAENIQLAIRYCLEHPHWRLSLQTHKLLGIP